MTTTKQSWFKRSLAVLLAVMMVMSMGLTNAFAADSGSELATFEITNTTADSAELTVTRIPEPLNPSTMEGVSLSGAYLVIPASEDTDQLDYYGVMAHEDAVQIGPIDGNTEFFAGYDRNTLTTGAPVVKKTSTYTLANLEPDTEYVLYSAVMSVGVAGSEECQRITFTTDAAGSELATFEITNTTADSAELTVTRIPEPVSTPALTGIHLSGAYLVIPASEDTKTLDYNGVMAHEDAVQIGPADGNSEFMLGYDYEDALQGIWTVSKTSTYTITGLEPGTEYVLYSAVMSVGVAGSEECQRTLFTTDTNTVSYTLSISDKIENGTVTTADGKNAYSAGTDVTLSVEPDEGYRLSELYYLTQDNTKVSIDTEIKTFSMPGEAITVYAVFTLKTAEDAVMELSYSSDNETVTNTYGTYQEAIKALNELDANCTEVTLKLLADVDTGTIPFNQQGAHSIQIGRSCTLDLSGYTLSGKPMYGDSTIIRVASATEEPISFTLTSSQEGGEIAVGEGAYGYALKVGAEYNVNIDNVEPMVTFLCKNITLRQSSSSYDVLHTNKYVKATIEDSYIYGGYRDNSSSQTVITRTTIQTDNTDRNALITFWADIKDSRIINTGETGTAGAAYPGALVVRFERAVHQYYLEEGEGGVSVSESTISAAGVPAVTNVYMGNSGNEPGNYTVRFDNTEIQSQGEAGICFDVGNLGINSKKQINLEIGDGTVVSSSTYALKSESNSALQKYIKVEAEENTYWQYGEGYIPFYPNSGAITFPENMRLSNTPEATGKYEGYYTFTEKTAGDQDFQTWDTLFAQAKAVYEAGNDDGAYGTTSWAVFEDTYDTAKIFDSAERANMNQVEIDYFVNLLQSGLDGLDEEVQELETGDYTAKITMYFNNQIANGTLSMSDAAFAEEVDVSVRGDEATLTFYVISPLPGWPQYDPTIADFKTEAIDGVEYVAQQGDTKVKRIAKADSDLFGVVRGTEYDCYPYTMTLPTSALTSGYIDMSIYVYPMEGFEHQYVDMVIGDFVKQEVTEPILVVDKEEVALILQQGSSQPAMDIVNAELVAPKGYTLSVASDKPSVATAEIDPSAGIIMITAVGKGTATITVTASNATNSISKTIAVTVAPEGSEAVKVAEITTSGNTETATLSGNFLTSGGADGIETDGSTITVDAKSTGSNITASNVVIPQETAKALQGKTVVVETNTGSITLDSALLSQIAGVENGVTLSIAEATVPTGLGTFSSAYEISLVDANGDAVEFGEGQATVTVTSEDAVNYAYCIENGSRTERVSTSTTGDQVSFTVSHFSLWALSDREYEVGGSASTGFFLEDGNYYVDIALWKSDSNEASMGNVAFKNNDKALVTVENGKITRVQIGTNPVDIDPYHSAIIKFELADGTEVSIDATGELTTLPANKDYTYIKLVSFNLPDSAQPDISDAITYVPVNFYVPDTPMDAAVGETLTARLRFTWSTAVKTDDTSLQVDDTTAAGDSPITGEEIVDVNLVDEATGIKLETNSGILSDKAVLSVEKLTQGADYDIAMKAMNGVDGSWNLYKIVALVDGVETAPLGSVVLYIPCGAEGMTLYRVNADGSKTLVKGEVQDGYYVIRTTSLGLFAMVGETAGTPGGNDNQVGNQNQTGNQNQGNTNIPKTGDTSNIVAYALLALAAAGMMGVTLVTRKRKSEES